MKNRLAWEIAKLKHEDGKNGYLYYISSKRVIDAKPYKKALARYANDARGWSRAEGLRNNSEYIEKDQRCYIKSTRKILKGQEIFVGYGREYWDTMQKLNHPKRRSS